MTRKCKFSVIVFKIILTIKQLCYNLQDTKLQRGIMEKGFTLAEVLITLAIVGVIGAIAIPSVIANVQQQEYKTGLKKAVTVLNAAITSNISIDGETPYDNSNLYGYLARHMSILQSTDDKRTHLYTVSPGTGGQTLNAMFYTTDGMRFEFRGGNTPNDKLVLYENKDIKVCTTNLAGNETYVEHACGGCGSYGLADNPYNTSKPPCLITVDINGDKKPSPSNAKCNKYRCSEENIYKYSDVNTGRLSDVFSIMITDSKAIPYGFAAQKAMYGNK